MKIIKKYSYTLGQNSYDCGIASIMTILLYFGIKPSREKIMNKTGIKQNGYSAYDLIRIGKTYGINGSGIKTSIESLKDLPAIAHTIKDKNMFHFIVILEKSNKKKILKIMDPSEGIKNITYEEFKKITTNIFLIFEKKKRKKLKNQRFKKEIIRICQNNKRIILKTIFASIIYILLSLIFNYYLKLMLMNHKNNNLLLEISIIFLLIVLIKNLINYLKDYLTYSLSKKIDKDITKEVTNHIFNLPYKYFISKTTGELVTIIEDIEYFKDIVTKIFILSLVDLILISCIIMYLSFLNLSIAIICVLVVLLLIIITTKYQFSFNDNYIKLKKSRIEYTSSLIDYFTSYETIKNLNIGNKIANLLTNKYNKSLFLDEKYNKKNYKYNLIITLLTDISYIFIIYLSLILAKTNGTNLFNVVLFSSIYYLVIGLLNNINESILLYKVYESSTDRVLDCLEIEKEKFNKTNLSKINRIKFDNISYQNDKISILKEINLELVKNDHIFITGKSGIGKSTLMKLLLRYLTQDEGNIFIDNININDLELSFIRENITYIGQDENIFSGTILSNLEIVSKDKEQIKKVTEITLLDNFFNKNNIDYNFPVEEQGHNLSGGERKKLILARGLLHLKNVLILDEVFNEISIEEEQKILKNIFTEYKDKIVIMISHRDTNKDLFNKQYTIEGDGRIHEIK